MRRIATVAVASVFMALPVHVLAPASAAPRPPTVGAVLADDGACSFTVTATWSGVNATRVIAQWHLDAVFWATSEAPGTGPNSGVIRGRTAVFHAGPLSVTPEPHASKVLVQFYNRAGAQVGETETNTITTNCGFASA